MRVTHLTDLHLSTTSTPHPVDTVEALASVLAAIPGDWRPDVVVVSGDVCHDGRPASYRLGAQLIGAHASGVPVLWVPGNHDQADGFAMLHDPGRGSWAHGAVEIAGQRFVLADSRVTGRGFGRWPAELGSHLRPDDILVIHHPPLSAPSALHHALRLRISDDERRTLALHGPRLVLSGHYHLWGTARIGTTTVVVAPAVANRMLTHDWAREQAVAEHGCALVDTGELICVRWVTGVGDGAVVLDLDPARVSTIAQEFGNPAEPGGGLGDHPPDGPDRWWVGS